MLSLCEADEVSSTFELSKAQCNDQTMNINWDEINITQWSGMQIWGHLN